MSAELIEDYDWESDESEDWESDEAFAESEDSVEDIGEARRRRRQRRANARSRMARPNVRGVQGVRVSGPSGTQSLRFPAKLATAAETNRGLASQEAARREIEGRLNRLETRSRALQKKDSSVTGLVTLAIGGGLAGFGAIQSARKVGGSRLQKWAAEPSTKTAALVSASQLAMSGARVVVKGGYNSSGIGMAADVFAAAQLAAFAFGSLNKPDPPPQGVADKADAELKKGGVPIGTLLVTKEGEGFRVVQGAGENERLLLLVR
jgi:hypothetical protein